MHEDQKEMKQLDTGWTVVLLIWGAILASLGIYLVVCIILEKELQINIDPKLPLETIKYALFGVSFITLFVVYYLRKFLLRTISSNVISSQTSSPQHPAVGKYLVTVIITSALLESIGIKRRLFTCIKIRLKLSHMNLAIMYRINLEGLCERRTRFSNNVQSVK